jgi:hypothetical protein
MLMGLQDKLNRMKESTKAKVPQEALEIIHRATEDLKNSGILNRVVKVGQKAPDFTLTNTENHAVNLYTLLTESPVLLVWYRGKW